MGLGSSNKIKRNALIIINDHLSQARMSHETMNKNSSFEDIQNSVSGDESNRLGEELSA